MAAKPYTSQHPQEHTQTLSLTHVRICLDKNSGMTLVQTLFYKSILADNHEVNKIRSMSLMITTGRIQTMSITLNRKWNRTVGRTPYTSFFSSLGRWLWGLAYRGIVRSPKSSSVPWKGSKYLKNSSTLSSILFKTSGSCKYIGIVINTFLLFARWPEVSLLQQQKLHGCMNLKENEKMEAFVMSTTTNLCAFKSIKRLEVFERVDTLSRFCLLDHNHSLFGSGKTPRSLLSWSKGDNHLSHFIQPHKNKYLNRAPKYSDCPCTP